MTTKIGELQMPQTPKNKWWTGSGKFLFKVKRR